MGNRLAEPGSLAVWKSLVVADCYDALFLSPLSTQVGLAANRVSQGSYWEPDRPPRRARKSHRHGAPKSAQKTSPRAKWSSRRQYEGQEREQALRNERVKLKSRSAPPQALSATPLRHY